MAEIKVEGLRHVYSAGTPFEKVALDGIDLEIPQGQLIGIIGHTGSGKSTFIQHLNALLPPTEGKIYVGGKDINADKYARKAVKGEVGLVFQYPEYQLFEETVYKDMPSDRATSSSRRRRSTRACARRRALSAWTRRFLSARRWSFRAGRSAASPSRA